MASDNSLVRPEYRLHPYQRQVYRDIIEALDRPERRVVAHLPTGAGKTRIATHVAAYMLNDWDDPEALIIWLAASEELCDQAAESLEKAWSHLGQREAVVHRYWGNRQVDFDDIGGGFLVTGLRKIHSSSQTNNNLLPLMAQVNGGIIFDEAHQAIAPTYSYVISQLCSKAPRMLGLTATPGRNTELSDDDQELAEMFERTKVGIDPKGYDSPVTYLINNRYLAAPIFKRIAIETEVEEHSGDRQDDYDLQTLKDLGANRERNQRIVDITEDALNRHRRILIFCPSVESALICADVFPLENVDANAITAQTPLFERRQIIEKFRSDEPGRQVVFNYGVLTAGFDAPRTSCVIIARPTKSLVLYSQMAGRALRGPQSGGNLRAEILTVVDSSLASFRSVNAAFENWEELWTTN